MENNGLYVASSDWHIRSSNPENRIDDYSITILGKARWFVDLCNKYNASGLISGDIFHNVRVPIKILNRLIIILKKCKKPIYAVAGQHDMEHHSDDLEPTPFFTLCAANAIIDVGSKCINNVYGIQWNGDISSKKPNDRSILILHYCVTDKEPAFYLKENALTAEQVLKNFGRFKFIISGDFHNPHVTKVNGSILINPGALGRPEIDKYNFKPRVYLLDVINKKIKTMYVPIQKPELVFREKGQISELETEFSEHIDKILECTRDEDSRPDFMTVTRRILNEVGNENQIKIAEDIYNEARNS